MSGIQGAQGSLGPTGASGIAGVQGRQGPLGPGGAQGATGPIGPTGAAGLANFSSVPTLSTISIIPYTQSSITNTIGISTNTISYIASLTLPPAVKSKAGLLSCYFNLSTTSSFMTGAYFDYGLYLDGVSLAMGDSQIARYSQISTYSVAMSWNGLSLGTNAITPYDPITIPVSIGANSCNLQIGIKNSSVALSGAALAPNALSNVITTTGSNFYTVPAGAQGVYVYLWGAGGGGREDAYAGPGSAGGGGGFVSGFYSCSAGTNLITVVGAVGGSSGSSGATSNGGPGNYYGAGAPGGGFSGLFLSNAGGIAQSNAIAIAGGGGGGGFVFQYNGWPKYGGHGGYTSGGNVRKDDGTYASASYSGGSQTAGGLGDAVGTALTGGTSFVGGGGGGWYGGSGNGNGYGGTGGSSYLGNINGATGGIGLTSGTSNENGTTLTFNTMPSSNAFAGGRTNTYYVAGKGVGNGSGPGLVVLVPLASIKATVGVAASIVC
jgi:hypothetical protein